MFAAVNRGKAIDHIARIIGLAGHSVPIFWLGLMALFVFYAKLKWVGASGRVDVFFEGMVTPVTGMLLVDSAWQGEWEVFRNALNHIALPGLILGVYSVAYISRMTRSFMLEQLGQEYIVAARAKGAVAAAGDLAPRVPQHPRPIADHRRADLRRPARWGGARGNRVRLARSRPISHARPPDRTT